MLRICFFLTCCDRNTSYHSINFWKGIRSARLHQWDFRCSFERSQTGSGCPRGRAASKHHAAQHRAARATSQCRDSPRLPTPAAGGPRRSHQCPGAHGRCLQQQQGEAVHGSRTSACSPWDVLIHRHSNWPPRFLVSA